MYTHIYVYVCMYSHTHTHAHKINLKFGYTIISHIVIMLICENTLNEKWDVGDHEKPQQKENPGQLNLFLKV